MDESTVKKILSIIPGAKRAAQGVIIPGNDGTFLHVFDMHDKKSLDGLTQDETFFFAFCSKSEILRLREIRGAHDYLLRLRAMAIVDSPRAVRVMRTRRSKFESTGRPWSLTHYYHSKDSYHKSYINLLNRSNAKSVKNIPAGLAFVPEVNALCIRSLAGDVIITSESLEHLYYFMSIAFYGEQLGIKPIDQVDALVIAIRIMNGSEALDFDIDPRGNLGHELERTISNLVKAQMQFTFGHEYAHLLCGHLSSDDAPNEATLTDNSSGLLRDLKTYNHDLEYQADLFALKNIEHNKDAYLTISHGAFSVLFYLHFLETVRKPCGLKELSISSTHPTSLDRVVNLHKNLGKRSPVAEKTLDSMLAKSNELSKLLAHRLKHDDRPEILTFYGSIYLRSYVSRAKLDRYEF